MSKKLGQEPAFPVDPHTLKFLLATETGISKRFYAACAAMQGLLRSPAVMRFTDEEIITKAYSLADELLKQENNE
jgi:hypothetical protein